VDDGEVPGCAGEVPDDAGEDEEALGGVALLRYLMMPGTETSVPGGAK
jgi:hypothetical protein